MRSGAFAPDCPVLNLVLAFGDSFGFRRAHLHAPPHACRRHAGLEASWFPRCWGELGAWQAWLHQRGDGGVCGARQKPAARAAFFGLRDVSQVRMNAARVGRLGFGTRGRLGLGTCGRLGFGTRGRLGFETAGLFGPLRDIKSRSACPPLPSCRAAQHRAAPPPRRTTMRMPGPAARAAGPGGRRKLSPPTPPERPHLCR